MFSQKNNFLQDTLRFCNGERMIIDLLQPLDKSASLFWKTPDTQIENTKKIEVYKQGKYFVNISSPNYPGTIIDSTYIKIYSKPTLYLKDTIICKGNSIVLDAKNYGMKYLWNTNEISQKINIKIPGLYWVKIMYGNCFLVDSIMVKSIESVNVFFNPEPVFCLKDNNKLLFVKAPFNAKFLWNTGATSSTINATKEGVYWFKVYGLNCIERTDTIKVKIKVCDCEMIIQNNLTPNEDGKNDVFFPISDCDYSYYFITISDRWSNVVYTSTDINSKWDGRFKNSLCPEDIYFYKIECIEKGNDNKSFRTGRISLIRK